MKLPCCRTKVQEINFHFVSVSTAWNGVKTIPVKCKQATPSRRWNQEPTKLHLLGECHQTTSAHNRQNNEWKKNIILQDSYHKKCGFFNFPSLVCRESCKGRCGLGLQISKRRIWGAGNRLIIASWKLCAWIGSSRSENLVPLFAFRSPQPLALPPACELWLVAGLALASFALVIL